MWTNLEMKAAESSNETVDCVPRKVTLRQSEFYLLGRSKKQIWWLLIYERVRWALINRYYNTAYIRGWQTSRSNSWYMFYLIFLWELVCAVTTVYELMEISYLSYQEYIVWQFYCDCKRCSDKRHDLGVRITRPEVSGCSQFIFSRQISLS